MLTVNPDPTIVIIKLFTLARQLLRHTCKVGIAIFIEVISDHKPQQPDSKE